MIRQPLTFILIYGNITVTIDRWEIVVVKFNTFSSRENDTNATSNVKRVAGVLAVAGAVFAGGCDNNQSGEVRHYSAGVGSSSSEQLPYGKDCNEHPDEVMTTTDMSPGNLSLENVGYDFRDLINHQQGDYDSTFQVQFTPEQTAQYNEGVALVDEKRLDPDSRFKVYSVSILNPDSYEGLNVDREAGTIEGDICVGAGSETNDDLSYED